MAGDDSHGAAGALFDLDRVATLRSELGASTIDGMIEDFLREMPDRLSELRQQIAACDWSAAERGFHSLRGAGLSLGLDALPQKLWAAERAVAEDGGKALGPLLDELDGLVPPTSDAFLRWKDGPPGPRAATD